jgi:hypothetical protein
VAFLWGTFPLWLPLFCWVEHYKTVHFHPCWLSTVHIFFIFSRVCICKGL